MDEPPDLDPEEEEEWLRGPEEGRNVEEEEVVEEDFGGGFLTGHEEKAHPGGGAPAGTARKPPLIAEACRECGANSFNKQMKEVFGIIVCKDCKKDDKYSVVTKTTAKEDYLVTDQDLKGLSFIKKDNPKKVQDIAVDRYGDLQSIELEKEKRTMRSAERTSKRKHTTKGSVLKKDTVERTPEAVQKDDGSVGIFGGKKARATLNASTPQARHKHEWGNERSEEKGGETFWKRQCLTCGLVSTFEKF